MTGFTLKIIATILMVIDHIGFFASDRLPITFRYIGRLSMPIFAFMLVQGFIHTRNVNKYIKRLFITGGIISIMNTIVSYIGCNVGKTYTLSPLQPNIFVSMGLALSILLFIKKIKEIIFTDKKDINYLHLFMYIIGILCLSIISLFTEYKFLIIGIILIFYYTRNNKILMSISYIVGSLILSTIFYPSIQYFMIFSLPIILLYNGKKGYSSPTNKYFFYIFYPIHIYLLYFIC